MHLPAHYAALRAAALPQLARGAAELDLLIDSDHDQRRGLTLLARPPAPITAALEAMLADFRRADPAQYYYPASDVHLTILSLLSCYPDFSLTDINPDHYRVAVREVLQGCAPFTITFSGLTASPGGFMVQGFPQDDGLAQLRDATRAFFQQSDLRQSIDQRYCLQTAHATVVRFCRPLANPARLLAIFQEYERHFFGTFEVAVVELVFNDWYQRAKNTVLLEKYSL